MVRTFVCLGVWVIAFFALALEARAKMVYYEVNAQRYSYSTTNRRQMQEARQRIKAANAWDAAKAKAQAERSANPFVAVFGSTAQREAKEAEARVQQVLSRATGAGSFASSSEKARSSSSVRSFVSWFIGSAMRCRSRKT